MAQTQGYTPKMATAERLVPTLGTTETSTELASQWRRLTRASTVVALVTSPAVYLWFHRHDGWPWYWSLLAAAGLVIAFRGLVDLGLRRAIPWPSLFGIEDHRLKEQDVVGRRRAWFWHRLVHFAILVAFLVTIVFVVQLALGKDVTWLGTGGALLHGFGRAVGSRTFWTQSIFVFFLFISNFLIFLGPMMLMGIDAWIVRWLARKARKLAAKWGGQCIVFIDEIDAVGTRRSALQGGASSFEPTGSGPFYGPWGALNPSGDLIVESRAWRERMFELRAPESRSPYPPWARKLRNLLNQGLFPGMMGGGGQLALHQLLLPMDGSE